MGSFVRFKLVRERTHVSGTFSRFANSFESITSVSLNCIGVASLRFRFELARGYKQMEWARVEKPKREWIKGQWVKGKASALWVNAVPGLRPGTMLQVCLLWFVRASLFVLLQELSKQRVIEFVAPASCPYQQSFIA